jgi:hypothetical protein
VSTDHRASQRQSLHEALALTRQLYDAELKQSVLETGAAKVRSIQQAAGYKTAMDDFLHQIEEIDQVASLVPVPPGAGRDPVSVHEHLRAHLYRIDFKKIKRWLADLMDSDCEDGRAGLLMCRRSRMMSGRLCAELLRETLKADTGAGKFRLVSVGLQPGDHTDVGAPLRRLADELDLRLTDGEPTEQLAAVTRTLCRSLQPGGIVLLTIEHCDYWTHGYPDALQWMVAHFWRQLLEDLKTEARKHGSVTIVVLLLFDGDLSQDALLPEHCCCIDSFRRERLLVVELAHWKRNEVEEWLARWGLPQTYPRTNTQVMVENIMKATDEGMPMLIEHQLLECCPPLW